MLVCALTLLTMVNYANSIEEMPPTLGLMVEKTLAGELEFVRNLERCEEIRSKVTSREDFDNLGAYYKNIYSLCDSGRMSYWSILDGRCSWYCAGGEDTISASSTLKLTPPHSTDTIHYLADNIHDLSYKMPWIEGVKGHGIGEYVVYHFPPHTPRITEIIIVNGYIRSSSAWQNHSRVRRLKMYVNNKPFAILRLFDSKQKQHFKFEPLGHGNREDWEELQTRPWWTIKFKILEVYEGDKYDKTAITEIYFDGIDDH